MSKHLTEALDTRVEVRKDVEGFGTIEIRFNSQEELERLATMMG